MMLMISLFLSEFDDDVLMDSEEREMVLFDRFTAEN